MTSAPATSIKTDNATASSFVNDMRKQNRTKSWDMNFHWLTDQKHFNKNHVYWDRGSNNNADYHTKHHAPSHHKIERPKYILKGFNMHKFKSLVCKGVLEHIHGTIRSDVHTSTTSDLNYPLHNIIRCNQRLNCITSICDITR